MLNPCISLPPNTIKAFINHTDVKVLSQVFNANSLFNIPYWLGGPSGQSYIGSSIHLFQNSKMSLDSRVKEHITHADNHRIAKHHKCKQPLLYGAMGSDLPLWFILPITNIIIGKGTSKKVRVLRNIETKFIKAVKTSLNVVGIVFPGKFRRYVKANIWSKHRHGKRKRHIPLKLPCS